MEAVTNAGHKQQKSESRQSGRGRLRDIAPGFQAGVVVEAVGSGDELRGGW